MKLGVSIPKKRVMKGREVAIKLRCFITSAIQPGRDIVIPDHYCM
jgi:hypothetical protein